MRAAAWEKTQVGLEFSIERHLSAYRWGGPVKTVNQVWGFRLQTKDLALLRQEDAMPQKLSVIAKAAKSGIPASSGVRQ